MSGELDDKQMDQHCRGPCELRLSGENYAVDDIRGGASGEEEVTNGPWGHVKTFRAHSEPKYYIIPRLNNNNNK